MVQNILKKRARAFSAEHGVPYLTALHAVDEPFHELRDLFSGPENGEFGFYMVPREGSYGHPYPNASIVERSSKPEELGRISSIAYAIELGRRLELLQRAKSWDIWSYRALHRGGLLWEGAPQMEPVFHHYASTIFHGQASMFSSGKWTGFYPVNLSAFLLIDEGIEVHLRPVTEVQLAALKAGTPAGPIEKRYVLSHYGRDSHLEEWRYWTESFSTAAISKFKDKYGRPLLAMLLKGTAEDAARELEARDLPLHLFDIEDVSGDRLDFTQRSRLSVRRNGESFLTDSPERLIIIR